MCIPPIKIGEIGDGLLLFYQQENSLLSTKTIHKGSSCFSSKSTFCDFRNNFGKLEEFTFWGALSDAPLWKNHPFWRWVRWFLELQNMSACICSFAYGLLALWFQSPLEFPYPLAIWQSYWTSPFLLNTIFWIEGCTAHFSGTLDWLLQIVVCSWFANWINVTNPIQGIWRSHLKFPTPSLGSELCPRDSTGHLAIIVVSYSYHMLIRKELINTICHTNNVYISVSIYLHYELCRYIYIYIHIILHFI